MSALSSLEYHRLHRVGGRHSRLCLPLLAQHMLVAGAHEEPEVGVGGEILVEIGRREDDLDVGEHLGQGGTLQVAELGQPEEESVLDGVHRVVDVHAGPVVPRDGGGPDAQPQILEAVVAVLGADVGDEVERLLEVDLVGRRVLLADVQLNKLPR